MTNRLSVSHENSKHVQRITMFECILISAFFPFQVLMVDSLKKALEVIEKSAATATIPREKKVLEEKSKQQQQQTEEKQKAK